MFESSEGQKMMNVAFDKFSNHEAAQQKITDRRGWDWCSLGATCGLAAGLVTALLGSLLTAISWLASTEGAAQMRVLGTALLVLMIPLLIFGAHCLDLIEKRKDRAREKRFHDPHQQEL